MRESENTTSKKADWTDKHHTVLYGDWGKAKTFQVRKRLPFLFVLLPSQCQLNPIFLPYPLLQEEW